MSTVTPIRPPAAPSTGRRVKARPSTLYAVEVDGPEMTWTCNGAGCAFTRTGPTGRAGLAVMLAHWNAHIRTSPAHRGGAA